MRLCDEEARYCMYLAFSETTIRGLWPFQKAVKRGFGQIDRGMHESGF